MDKVYFLSDSHLGIPDRARSLEREKILVRWLDKVSEDASEIFLLGDIFDYWFEYRTVIPKGYARLLGKLAEVADRGIPVHYFTGNHDMWAFGYFEQELGLIMHRHPIEIVLQGKRCLIGHGDGLGPGDHGYKLIKSIFSSRLAQKLFSFLHPGFGSSLAGYFSAKSRTSHCENDRNFMGEDKEYLILYSKKVLNEKAIDYFIFGHRHYPINIEIAKNVRFINTGDWITHFSYAVMERSEVELKVFRSE